ncbi:hypothetical protein NKR23_g814 [Pleurostoma richardsiae]|uniref:DUF7726 domain-containing protein n=1 Tax=Pleurostoma richardsiae TaxID=41990 RepID=A0AA38RQR3_9PEZI|nr:hypothetical protein NKR23_g814 [Pleurostoma richardsiae]
MDSGWSWSPSNPLANVDTNRWNPKLSAVEGPTGDAPSIVDLTGDKENALPTKGNRKPAATKKARALGGEAPSRKRKSDPTDQENEDLFPTNVPDIDDDDPRLCIVTDTCSAVRKKIRTWIDSGAMKVGEFQSAIGVSSKGYLNFMNRTKTYDGEGCDTYWKAFAFFKKRDLQGLPLKAGSKTKKARTGGAGGRAAKSGDALIPDLSNVYLPGEEEGTAPVYDTCDEMRKKIRAFLAKDGITQAAFLRAISKSFPDNRKVAATSLQAFLGQKGPRSGNTSGVFYGAYVFFEKLRIKEGRPKTKFAQEMEEIWSDFFSMSGRQGFDVENNTNRAFLCSANARPTMDKYGWISFH